MSHSSDPLSPDTPLNTRQRAFVAEYVQDFNATQAAIRVGYSSATAGSIAGQLLQTPKIREAIDTASAVRTARTDFKGDKVVAEMSALAHSDLSHYVIDDLGNVTLADGAPPDAMKAVQSIKKKIKTTVKDGASTTEYDVELRLWDKPTPLKLMGRHVGLFPDKVEVTGPGGGALQVQGMTDEEIAKRAVELAAQAAAIAKGGE